MNGSEGRIFGLDVIRATAILLVIFSHYYASTLFGGGGLLGVEIFFVLSGFLIGDILVRSFRESGATFATLTNFWMKRWFRTLPNYAVFLLLHVAVLLLATSRPVQVNLGLYPLFLQNFFQPIPAFFVESWSLSVEEWFYLLFPLLVVALHWGVKRNHRAMLTAITCFLIFPLLLRCYASQFWNLQTIRMVVPLRLDTMMYGVLTAIIMNYHPSLWSGLTKGFLLVPATGFLGCGLYLVHHESRFASVVSFPLIAIGVALSIPFLRTIRRWGIWGAATIEYISKVSYSTYLLHMPLFFFIENFISWGNTPLAIKFLGRLSMIIATLLLSYLPYKYIELPFLSMRRRLLTK